MKTSALSLRLDDALAQKLEWLATKFRVPETQIIRWAIEALHDYTMAHGGRCMMPIDFTSLWKQLEAKALANTEAKTASPIVTFPNQSSMRVAEDAPPANGTDGSTSSPTPVDYSKVLKRKKKSST